MPRPRQLDEKARWLVRHHPSTLARSACALVVRRKMTGTVVKCKRRMTYRRQASIGTCYLTLGNRDG
jgi:hypothetical protein